MSFGTFMFYLKNSAVTAPSHAGLTIWDKIVWTLQVTQNFHHDKSTTPPFNVGTAAQHVTQASQHWMGEGVYCSSFWWQGYRVLFVWAFFKWLMIRCTNTLCPWLHLFVQSEAHNYPASHLMIHFSPQFKLGNLPVPSLCNWTQLCTCSNST